MLTAALAAVTTVAGPVIAGVVVENQIEGSAEGFGRGLVFLDYASGTHLDVAGQSDWDAGAYATSNADAASGGSLALQHRGDVPPSATPNWWNTAWGVRRCVTVNNPGTATTETPVEIVFDTNAAVSNGEMIVGGDDLRAIDSTTGLELPLWVEGTIPATASEVWVQLANVPTGASEFCLYHGNPTAPTVSDQSAVFTYSTALARYYTVSEKWDGSTLSLVSFVDNNTVTVGGNAPITINQGQVVAIGGVNRNTIITATGPVTGASTGDTTDTIIPESFADTSFVFSSQRNQQVIWVRSPFGTSTLEFQVGGVPVNTTIKGAAAPPAATQTITPADGSVGIIADAGAGQGVFVRSTNGQRFLAAHVGDAAGTDADGLIGVPWLGEDVYGVRSRYLQVTAGATAATFSIRGSDGTNLSNITVGPSTMNVSQVAAGPIAVDRRGQGPATRVSANAEIAASQYADENGSESTSFLPYSLLDREFYLPINANYIAIACPVVGQTITMTEPGNVVTNLTCTNPGGLAGAPGKAYVGIRLVPAGTHLESAQRFFVYIEKQAFTDEINLTGAKATAPSAALSPALTLGELQGLYVGSGSWASPAYDVGTSGVFGLLNLLATVPAGTTASVQMASGSSAAAALAAPLLGPDGTPGTSYGTGGEVVAGLHDFDQFVRFAVTLTSTDPLLTPTVQQIDLSTDLEELTTSSQALTTVPVSAGPGLASHLVARAYGTGTLTYSVDIRYVDGTGLPAADAVTVRTDQPADHVRVVGGAIVQGQGPPLVLAPGTSFSIIVDEDIQPGNVVTMDMTVSAIENDGVVLEHDLRLVLSS